MIENPALAFPRQENEYHHGAPGMELRDYIAAKAMAALIADPSLLPNVPPLDPETVQAGQLIAQRSYYFADAMMKERAK